LRHPNYINSVQLQMELRNGKIVRWLGDLKTIEQKRMVIDFNDLIDGYGNRIGHIKSDDLGDFAFHMVMIINKNHKTLMEDRFTRFRKIMIEKIDDFRSLLENDLLSFSENYNYDWDEDQIHEVLTTCRQMIMSPRESWRFWDTPFWIRNKGHVLV